VAAHTHERLAFFLPSLEGGGAQRVMLNLAAGFCDRGFRADLVLASAEGDYLPSVPSAVRVIDLGAQRVLRSLVPLVRYLRRERPRVLIAGLDHANVVAMVASRIARARNRTVISVHCVFGGTDAWTRRDFRLRALPWLLGRLHRWADAVVAVSDGVADDLTRTAGVPSKRIRVILNPVITPTLIASAGDRPAHPWFEDTTRPIIISAGRLVPQKNFSLLIESFALVRRRFDVRLVILGEGPDRAGLEASIRRHGVEDCVALPGFVPNPYACMARASVFVLSSDYEGLPTVLVESLALGTPVIATDCESGPREILRGGALGDLVPVRDVEAMSQAIVRALTRPRGAPQIEALKQFTVQAALDEYERVFNLDA
jgi:glycosyltransferase involved in cell wall biosynthesis